MKRHTKIAVALVAGAIAASAAGAAVMASDKEDKGRVLMASYRGHGDGGERHHGFNRHKMGARMARMFEEHDLNKDGAVTQEEVDTRRKQKLEAYDADKNGSLSLGEFEKLWLDHMRSRMVDGFQRLDDDGSGNVTIEEYSAPFARIIDRHDFNKDGKITEKEFWDRMRKGKKHGKYDDDDDD